MLRTIKMLMRFAIDENIRADDPTFGVKKIRLASSDGFHSWSEDEVAAYEARHPVGTKARLALDLLLYTAQRRADVARMGPQHVEQIDGEDMIRVKQQKTGVELLLPILPPLATSLAATPTGHLVFLTTTSGKPFTPAGFGNWFRDRCREAGLRDCPAHGLRKAATKRLADAGCTDEEMMAWTGHGTRAMLTRYSKGANQKRLAKAGVAKPARSESEQVAVKPGATIVKP
jgi:integrase